jgi:hypothetical protein
MNREAAIEAGARALRADVYGEVWPDLDLERQPLGEYWTRYAAAVLDAALPHLVPDVETLAGALALAYGGHISPPRGGRDWKAAEAVLALLVPVEDAP